MFIIDVFDFSSWRKQARELIRRGLKPDTIAWQTPNQQALFFGNESEQDFLSLPVIHSELTIPKQFFNLAENVACFRDESKWALLYSVAWRLLFTDRHLLSNSIDKEVSRLLSMQKSVNRDKHKMAAFVRFKRIKTNQVNNTIQTKNSTNLDKNYYVAWFEPEHLIVPLKVHFFIKRFNNMSWSILTPDICAHWNQKEIKFTEGISQGPKIEDELETLWLEYYKNIFNPARLKIKAMQAEMPKKYWINLPEAQLINDLIRNSSQKTDIMLDKKDSVNTSKISESAFVKKKQIWLRQKRESSKN